MVNLKNVGRIIQDREDIHYFNFLLEARSIPFKKFDKNNDGFISKSEFKRKIKRMLKKLGVVSSNEEIMDAFNLFDSNGDGKISPDEFEADVPLPKKATCLVVIIIRQK